MYLSKIYIKNFRGIKELLVEFDKNLNVIIQSESQLTSLNMLFWVFFPVAIFSLQVFHFSKGIESTILSLPGFSQHSMLPVMKYTRCL